MQQYLDLLGRILYDGENVQSGAVIKSEDRKATCRMLLAQQLRFDLREGFPICTTKPVPFDIVVDEVLWFLRGETNTLTLGRKIGDRTIYRHIWDQWANAQNEVPHIYGETWRHWYYPQAYQLGVSGREVSTLGDVGEWDQVDYLLKQLKTVVADPGHRARRRIILTGWNPPVVPEMGLAPCHTLSQWLPTNGYLDVVCHWRSIDMFLGCPFNIIQYALLTYIFGTLAGLNPRHLVVNIADCHLYDNQFDQVVEQRRRKPQPLPYLKIDERFFMTCPDLSIDQVKEVEPAWFSLDGYTPHEGKLRAEVAV
jgi:thymidylate synthase